MILYAKNITALNKSINIDSSFFKSRKPLKGFNCYI